MSLIEYHDPDNIFDVVAPDIQRKLPLTNLHWKSSSRPLRSIESLHVSFVRADDAVGKHSLSEKESATSTDTNDASGSTAASGQNRTRQSESTTKAQRHQIPGLRQTPYLKLLLFRCDDKETYKSRSKDAVREWIKEHVPASGSTKKDDHNAFEWLILHVVFPNTLAASEPRWSKKNTGPDQDVPKERSSSAGRWPGKSSRTILERLRMDFNRSNKSAPDRIAQIRLSAESLPKDTFPSEPPSGVTCLTETPREHDNACEDLISKIKTLVLQSFDFRVTQYEEDIRQKENQQSLPGWNFCTFFVLKEGLARAFESVGLLDDALAVYDELDVGLDASLRSRSLGVNDAQATSFPDFTPDLHDKLVSARTESSKRPNEGQDFVRDKPLPLNHMSKDYRALIVSNSISVYDFRSYIFAREMAILLRLANIRSSQYPVHENGTVSTQDVSVKRESAPQQGPVHNAIALAELCRRAVQFTPSIARMLREDIRAGFEAEGVDLEDVQAIIDKAVLSTTFSIAQQILDETSTSDLAAALPIHEPQHEDSPKRRRSLRRSSLPTAQTPARGPVFAMDPANSYGQGLKSVVPLTNAELANVAAYRADLYLLQRRVLESIEKHFQPHIEERDGQEEDDDVERELSVTDITLLGSVDLRRAVSSAEEFSQLYEALTNRAAFHYAAANRIKSSERLAADIARLKLDEGDYAAAALYYSQIMPSMSTQNWSSIESSILYSYRTCLKALHRKDDFVRISLALLKQIADVKRSQSRRRSSRQTARNGEPRNRQSATSRPEQDIFQHLFAELVEFSKDLPYDFSSPLETSFANLRIDPSIRTFEAHDGFGIRLTVRQLVAEQLSLEKVTVRLINPTDSQARNILLQSEEVIDLGSEASEILLMSRTSAIGHYIVDKITFQSGKLLFVDEPIKKSEPASLLTISTDTLANRFKSAKNTPILLYQRPGALFADIQSSSTTHVGRKRHVDITLDTGSNEISHAEIIVRSATAGLRIHCGEAEPIDPGVEILDKKQQGRIELGPLKSGGQYHIQVPYELERNVAELSIPIEVHYTTVHGEFVFSASAVVRIELALDVNVQDVFTEHLFYAKFLIKPQGSVPIRVLGADMGSSEQYDSEPVMHDFDPFIVAPDQPAIVTYRIRKKETADKIQTPVPKKPILLLTVYYRSLLDDILSHLVSKLEESLAESQLSRFRRVLVQSLRKSITLDFPLEEYQSSLLTGRCRTPPFQKMRWMEILDGIRKPVRQELRLWLENWHEENATLTVPKPGDADYSSWFPANKVLIDFELPHLQYLHIVSLNLLGQPMNPRTATDDDDSTETAPAAPLLAKLGQPLQARLRIRHTRRWDLTRSTFISSNSTNSSKSRGQKQDPKSKSQPSQQQPTASEKDFFTYEIFADPVDWLVAGPRRARFSAIPAEEAEDSPGGGQTEKSKNEAQGGSKKKPSATSTAEFDVSLVPARTGYLFLPYVEVLPAPALPPLPMASSGAGSVEVTAAAEDEGTTPPPVAAAAAAAKATAGAEDVQRGDQNVPPPAAGISRGHAQGQIQTQGPERPYVSSQTHCTSVHAGVEVVEGVRSTTVGFGVDVDADADAEGGSGSGASDGDEGGEERGGREGVREGGSGLDAGKGPVLLGAEASAAYPFIEAASSSSSSSAAVGTKGGDVVVSGGTGRDEAEGDSEEEDDDVEEDLEEEEGNDGDEDEDDEEQDD